MPLYWLGYRHDNQISVVIEPGASLIHARLRSRLMGWMKASSPKATSLIASGNYRRRRLGDGYRRRKRRGCWLTSNNALGPMASAYQSSCRVRYQIGSALP